MSNPLLHIETHTSEPIRINRVEVRVRSQVIQLRLPIANGGLIWNRPIVVLVKTSDHQEQILPVQDATRTVVLALTMLCFATLFFTMLFRRKTA